MKLLKTPAFALLLLWAAMPASAQKVYQCKEGAQTVYSDRPCPGASATQVQAVPISPPARPSGTYVQPVAPGGVLPSAGELEGRCRRGDAGACDFLACANRNDRAACARAQGSAQGRGPGPRWTAVSTRDVQRPQKDETTGVRMVREQEIIIECDGGRRGMVVARRDISRYKLSDGGTFGSLEAAATAVCTR